MSELINRRGDYRVPYMTADAYYAQGPDQGLGAVHKVRTLRGGPEKTYICVWGRGSLKRSTYAEIKNYDVKYVVSVVLSNYYQHSLFNIMLTKFLKFFEVIYDLVA